MENQGRPLKGDLETLSLPATLKMLSLGGKTGILEVISGQERLRIALQNGNIVALEDTLARTFDIIHMFRLLHRLPPQREKVTQLRQLAGNNPVTALMIMEQWGIIHPTEMQQRIEFGITQALSRAVRWERGSFEFQRDVTPIQALRGAHQPLNVDHVLLEAMRLADEMDNAPLSLARTVVPRWMSSFQGDVSQLGLSSDDLEVLCLTSGQFSLAAIAYGLRKPETHIAAAIARLLPLGLVELVDAQLESELEHSLYNLLTQSQHDLAHHGKTAPDQRQLILVRTLGSCVNGLIAHHAVYARTLRGRGEIPPEERERYLRETFGPMMSELHLRYARMDGIITFEQGQIQFDAVLALHREVRGHALSEYYWDAANLLFEATQRVFVAVLGDEAGQSRLGRQLDDLWQTLLREIHEEIVQLAAQHPMPGPAGGYASGQFPDSSYGNQALARAPGGMRAPAAPHLGIRDGRG